MKIKLLDSPIANFTADDPIYMNYYKVKFYDNSQINTGSIVDYYWDFGDGKFAYNRNTTHNYYYQAIFDVSLTVTANNGCFDTELKENFINLNLIGVREKDNIPTIKLYPNPSSADIQLVTDFKMKEIIIYNSLGELIEKKEIMDYRFTIQKPGKGLYYFKIMDVKDNLYIEKVIFN
ncbi:MAG: PKD domain-containing protein [Bacteroidetes bacterium]|nr:PKD domain-containing protein [Bacteroidota bacterium]